MRQHRSRRGHRHTSHRTPYSTVRLSKCNDGSLVGCVTSVLDGALQAGEEVRTGAEAGCVCCFAAGGLEGCKEGWSGARWKTGEGLGFGYRFHAWYDCQDEECEEMFVKRTHCG